MMVNTTVKKEEWGGEGRRFSQNGMQCSLRGDRLYLRTLQGLVIDVTPLLVFAEENV